MEPGEPRAAAERRDAGGTAGRHDADGTSPRWGRRLAWLVGLWIAGVAALSLAAWLLKGFMRWAGLTT